MMAKQDFGFDDRRRQGITRYIVWTIVACLALGAFLYADGAFDEILAETTGTPAEPAAGG
jgi:hypothetical protein